MAQDLLTTFKYGWKTSYYQNTYDVKTDEIELSLPTGEKEVGIQGHTQLQSLVDDIMASKEEECESCAI